MEAITANQITALLADKHGKDVFVSQCKTGATWGANFQIMDAWAMKRSWAHPRTIGYEIKVSRSDFLNDSKWPGYLPYCNEFYWVAPVGLIDPTEVSDGVGLLAVAKTGTRLFTKRKAAFRDIEIDQDILRYVLMHRVTVSGGTYDVDRLRSRDFWRQWLEEKEEDRAIGHRVSTALSAKYSREVTEVECKQRALEVRIKQLEMVEQLVNDMGIDLSSWSLASTAKRQVQRTMAIINPDIQRMITAAAESLQTLAANLKSRNPKDD